MCGICGQLRLDGGNVGRDQIAAMCASLGHRGPDDRGVHCVGPVGLGVTRLAIIDLEGGHQPVSNEGGTVWAVQNGEIYNYRQLRAELISAGHRFASHGDTEVLAHLYEAHGVDFVHHLRGMFAVAIWDGGKRRLVLARDRLGIKPLCYAVTNGTLTFGSEIKALLAAGLDRQLDPVALHDYLSFDFVPGPRTMFAGIRKLPAGHVLVCDVRGDGRSAGHGAGHGVGHTLGNAAGHGAGHDAGHETGHGAGSGDADGDQLSDVTISRYWDLPRPDEGEPSDADPAELVRALRERLEDAVRAHMVSDVPLGAFLSGGLDSSVVVALMSRAAGGGVSTFSIGFRERSYNELPYARLVAAQYGTDHRELIVEPAIEDVIDDLVAAFDEPFADSSAVAAWYVARVAAEHTKVVLSGDGGDEVFGGYVIYQADRLARYYRRLPGLLGGRLIPSLTRLLPASDAKMSWDLKLRRFAENARRDPLAAHMAWRMIFDEESKRRLYSRRFVERHAGAFAGDHSSIDSARALFDAYPCPDAINRFMYVDTKVNLVDDMLTKVDRTSMAHGLEVRVPLLDHQLVEWMSRLPSRHKVRGLTLKHLLKQVARQLLPREVVDRPKAGFHVPVPGWLKNELRPLVERQLGAAAVARQGVFEPRYVRSLLEDHYAGRHNYSRNIWGLLMFSLWHDRHLADGGDD